MIERKILIGLITNTEFLQQIESEWNQDYMESSTARIMAGWCWDYYKKYQRAPMHDIEGIFIQQLKKGLDEDLAEEIETEILPELSSEYTKSANAITFLLDETLAYFIERQIKLHNETIQYYLDKGDILRARKEIENFELKEPAKQEGTDLSDVEVLEKLDKAFDVTYQNVIRFPGALGDFWNNELRKGGFVALMGMAKRGKTFWILEFMMRAYRQKKKIVFFQAGDMTESEQLIRISTYLAKKSVRENDLGTHYIPMQDCIKNQLDMCNKSIRECNFGIFDTKSDRKEIKREDLIEALHDYPTYKSCYNCSEWLKNKWGSVWFKEVFVKNTLKVNEAKELWQDFFINTQRSIRLFSYVNGTLTVSEIRRVLNVLKKEGFEPELILIDYVDIMESEKEREQRHKENEKWKGLRSISQEFDALVITPTQTDADSYTQDRLSMSNFTEDRRKYDHVTAMYGLNQDKEGREKGLGIMRINRIVLREGDFHSSQEVHVLQQLSMGRPFLGSYY